MSRRTAGVSTAFLTLGVMLLAGVVDTGATKVPAATDAAAAAVAPAAVAEPSVRFAAAGDFAQNSSTQAVLSTMASLQPDLHLALGDLSYGATGAEQTWCDLVTGIVGAGTPFELVAGNHESNGQNGNINDFSACLPNQLPGVVGTYGRQWYVDVPAGAPLVRFVMISPALTFPDGTWSYASGTPRYAWTAAAIDGARTASIPWVVVGMHKPCLSVGDYGCDPGTDLINMLLTKKVDLILNGHEHLYQRTHQLGLSAGCPALVPLSVNEACITDSDSAMVRGAGTVFATVGTGGQSQRVVHTDDVEAPYFAAASGLGAGTTTWGPLDVTVTATTMEAQFVRASGGTFTDRFTIGPPTGNAPPVASFTAACTQLDCSVDAGASTDSDGTIASYAWAFGDGTTATGVTATHRYAAGGSYPVTLTVTDDRGSASTTSRTVTATAPPSTALAADTFTRTVAAGFGTADTGGAWRTGTSTAYSVSNGAGVLRWATPGGTLDASLPSVSSSATDLVFSSVLDKPATGGGLFLTVGARRVAGVGEYRANVRYRVNGVVELGLARTTGGTETVIVPVSAVPGLTMAPGEKLMVRTQVTGTNPTLVRARVWKDGTPEPTTWRSGTDSTAGLQAPGAIGIKAYLSSSTTNAPVTLRLDDLLATAP